MTDKPTAPVTPEKPKRIRRTNAEVAAEKAAIAAAKAAGLPIPKKRTASSVTAKKAVKKAAKKAVKKSTSKKPTRADTHVLDRHWDKCVTVMDQKFRKNKIVYGDPLKDAAHFEFDDLLMHYLFGSKFIRTPGLFQVLAPQSSGKTSLFFSMIGGLVRTNHLCVYFECEEKRFKTSQILRLLSRNKKEARQLARRFKIIPVGDVVELFTRLEKMAPELRKIADSDASTAGKPVWIFVDTWSTLMSKAEAKGRISSADEKDKIQSLDETTNLGHSQFANRMKRVMPTLFRQYNIQLVFGHHPTTKIDMSGSYASRKAPPVPDWANDTTTGGKAMHNLAAYRMSMTTIKMLRNSAGETVGRRVKLFVQKNSFGCEARSVLVDIKMDPYDDTEDAYECPISFAETTAEWLAEGNVIGTTVTKNRYTCAALGCFSVTAAELYTALMSHDTLRERVGSLFRIEGYQGVESTNPPEVLAAYQGALDAASTADEESEEIFGADFGGGAEFDMGGEDEQDA